MLTLSWSARMPSQNLLPPVGPAHIKLFFPTTQPSMHIVRSHRPRREHRVSFLVSDQTSDSIDTGALSIHNLQGEPKIFSLF